MLTVATYNIQHGSRFDLILKNVLELKSRGCAIICLQEVHDEIDDVYVGDALREALGETWNAIFLRGNGHSHGLGIFWNTNVAKLENKRELFLPILQKQTFIERWSTKKTMAERGALIALFKIGTSQVRVTNAHLDWEGGYGHRNRQLATIAQSLNEENFFGSEILCGDFNTTGPALLYKRYQKKLYPILSDFEDSLPTLKWSQDILTSINPKDSLPNGTLKLLRKIGLHLRQRLDHLFYRNLKLQSAERLDTPGSDHYPLIATFDF